MTSFGASIVRVLLTSAVLCVTGSVFAQITSKDTATYLPEYFDGALEYNLMVAASKGLDTEVERLILRGADIEAETEEGATPLIMAVANIRLYAVNTLLRYNANPNKVTNKSATPLYIILNELVTLELSVANIITESRQDDCMAIAESLIRYGADIDFQDSRGVTVLNYASVYGNFRFADLLLYYMADIDKKASDGTTPLMASIWSGYANIADLLIQNGANMEARDNLGFTPLLIAAQNGDTLLIDYLKKRGVDLYEKENNGWDALSLAIKYDHRDAAELLIRSGEKWKDPGRSSVNYYNVAVKYGRTELFKLLEKNGFPDQYKPHISQIEISLSSKMNPRDIYAGLNLFFREPRKNMGMIAGFDTKLWYSRVMVKKTDVLFYQYQDKSSIVYAGFFKDIPLTDNPLKSNFIFSGSLCGAYWFGNKFKGTEAVPESKFKVIPAVTIKFVKRNFCVHAGFEYMNTDFYKAWPVWLRAGVSYNFDLKHSRTPVKTIKWY